VQLTLKYFGCVGPDPFKMLPNFLK